MDRAGLSRLVAYIFQDPDLQIFLPTVEEELAYGLKLQGLATAEIAAQAAGRRGELPPARARSPRRRC